MASLKCIMENITIVVTGVVGNVEQFWKRKERKGGREEKGGEAGRLCSGKWEEPPQGSGF